MNAPAHILQKEHPTILIADDEPEIQNVLRRFLSRQGYDLLLASNGEEALGKAKMQNPSIVLLDVNMPKMSGFSVCEKLRQDPATRLTPILMLTARGATDDKVKGLRAGADDYLAKPFAMDELQARIETLLKRTSKMISVNPLTRLPGSPSIQDEIEKRLAAGKTFGVAYIDIDHFKAYNDAYGYHQGDQVISWTAKMIESVLKNADENAPFDHFLGHIGGDDFVLVADASAIRVASELIAQEFDRKRTIWYNWWDALKECVQTKDRQGKTRRFPLMALSIAIASNEQRRYQHFGEIAQIVSEMKKFVKGRAEQNQSRVACDRRTS